MSHHPLAVAQPVSTFVMEVLPWAASGVIGLYLLWGTCIASEPARTQMPAEPGVPALSSLAPAREQGSTAARRALGIAALPDLMTADQSLAHAM